MRFFSFIVFKEPECNVFMACRFKSNYFESGSGFKLEYSPTSVSTWSYSGGMCGGNFTSANGILTSPNFPKNSPYNTNCVYIISMPNGTYVNLQILALEMNMKFIEGNTNPCPMRDCIEIRDGHSEQSPELIMYPQSTTDEIPFATQSTQNHVWIR